jgi:hypothetical protein
VQSTRHAWDLEGVEVTGRTARAAVGCERGVALLVALFTIVLLSAIGAALVLLTDADILIAANAGASSETMFAADAVLERTFAELRDAADLTSILNGSRPSAFVDGLPAGQRDLPDGRTIDLSRIESLANCQKPGECTVSDLNAVLRGRPWGARNPRWRLFSYGPLAAAPEGIRSDEPVYVVSMVADDPGETDDDPSSDGVPSGAAMNPGAGTVLVRGEAFGVRGSHRTVEAVVTRWDLAALAAWEAADPGTRGEPPDNAPFLQVRAWRDVR